MYSATEGGWHRHQPDWYPYTYRSSGLWSNCDKWTWDSYRAGETGTDKCAQVWIRKNGKSFSPCLSRMWNRCSPVDIPMYSHERHRQLHLVQVSVCGIFSSPPTAASFNFKLLLSSLYAILCLPDNSPLSHSALPVWFLPYWSFQLHNSL